MDPRKPIRWAGGDEAKQARSEIHAVLLAATEAGTQQLGCTGLSFVTSSMGIWAQELAEVDARAAAQLLQAIAVIIDPNTNTAKKIRAEKKRKAAVQKLAHAVDLEMAVEGVPKH